MDNRIFFQDFMEDGSVIIRGCIDPDTGIGFGEVFRKTHSYHIDIEENGVQKDPKTYEEQVYVLANNEIERIKSKRDYEIWKD